VNERSKAGNKQKAMKIAVTSQGPDLDSPMDSRFGRAKYFLVVDTDSGEFAAHPNELNLNAVQGAGIQTGRSVILLGVRAVVTGNVGPKAFATLDAGNIPVYTASSGTVREVVEQFKAGTLNRAENPNVEGHWA